jgi:hypothetical protein
MQSHRENEIACVGALASTLGGRRMSSGKKKSPAWRPWDKRRTPAQFRAKRAAADAVTARRDSNRRGVWHSCPRRRCRRVECCGGEPVRCQERSRSAIAQQRKAAPPAANVAAATAPPQRPAAPVMSAREAAAAIKASIAAMPPEPHAGEELEKWFGEGGIQYRPRKR